MIYLPVIERNNDVDSLEQIEPVIATTILHVANDIVLLEVTLRRPLANIMQIERDTESLARFSLKNCLFRVASKYFI